jgi:hypothetical protein
VAEGRHHPEVAAGRHPEAVHNHRGEAEVDSLPQAEVDNHRGEAAADTPRGEAADRHHWAEAATGNHPEAPAAVAALHHLQGENLRVLEEENSQRVADSRSSGAFPCSTSSQSSAANPTGEPEF